ncbi:MAG: HDIG domain-containing protein [Bacteroidetes bacterium]|nr:HDIG domain-containing protein [Bacteroidota bacterium]
MSEHKRKASFPVQRAAEGKEEAQGVRSLRWKSWVRYVALALSIAFIALLFPRSSMLEYEFELGSVWNGDTVRAPFAFPIYKDDATYEQDTKRAMAGVLPVYVPGSINSGRMRDTLHVVAAGIAVSQNKPSFLSDNSWNLVQSIPLGDTRAQRLQEIADALSDAIVIPYDAGVIEGSKASLQSERIAVRRSEAYEEVLPLSGLFDSLDVMRTAEASLSRRLGHDESVLAMELLRVLYTPSYIYSPRLTAEARENAKSEVTRSLGVVAENELIVATGERITDATRLKLVSYERSRRLREEEENVWFRLLGNVGHTGVLMMLGVLFLYNFRPRIFSDNLQLGIIIGVLLLVAVLSYLSLVVHAAWPVEYLILMPLLSMLLAILFDSRTAFYMTVIACFMVAGIRGNDYAVALACLSAGVLAAYTVRDIKSRTQLFRSITFSMIGYAFAIVALGIERGDSVGILAEKLGSAAINATLSPVLTFGCIFVIEKFFGVATDLKLLEYDNLNHPLLRALADKAPGTYQHTLTIARLAESAANAIGANALLAKVGAYFHDVGKIAKAEYFVENQMQMGNKHDKLKPEKSAQMIRNHVQDGIELAREYGLPQRIIDFIPMHHGTTVIRYFFDKARETNPEANEDDFRYPGPRPQSRETAIVMLADAVEATTRALPNPTPKAIEETIDRAIKRRFSDGQLDQCELTLADLNRIKIAFTKNLIGMSHPRIQYKPEAGEQSAPEPEVRRERQEPMIPYIDDAFGSIDAEISYGKGEKKGGSQ